MYMVKIAFSCAYYSLKSGIPKEMPGTNLQQLMSCPLFALLPVVLYYLSSFFQG